MLINIVAVQLHYGRTMKLSFYESLPKELSSCNKVHTAYMVLCSE